MKYSAKIWRPFRISFFLKQETGWKGWRGSRDLKLSKSTAFMMHESGGLGLSKHMLRSLLAFGGGVEWRDSQLAMKLQVPRGSWETHSSYTHQDAWLYEQLPLNDNYWWTCCSILTDDACVGRCGRWAAQKVQVWTWVVQEELDLK